MFKTINLLLFLLTIPIFIHSSCEVGVPSPPCPLKDLDIRLDFFNASYPDRNAALGCNNIPITDSNPCTSNAVNELAGAEPATIATNPPSSSEYYCTIEVSADCEGFPMIYGWTQNDVNIDCVKRIQIPDGIDSYIEVTFVERCTSCNISGPNCFFSREKFFFGTALGGYESDLLVEFSYQDSFCSTNEQCN